MKISIIAAMSKNRVIGKNNLVPWHIKEDLIRLKKLTLWHTVVLGRKTFESMVGYYERTGRPTMLQRTHVVVTRDPSYKVDPKFGFAVNSIEEAIKLAKQKEKNEVFVLGGEKIFQQTIDLADKLYLTVVDIEVEGDAFFPDYSQFKKIISEEKKESGGYKYKFLELEK